MIDRFQDLYVLKYLLTIPLLLFVGYFYHAKLKANLNKAFGKRLYPFLSSSVSNKKRKWKIFLQALVLIFMLLALARPQAGKSKQEVKAEGVELMFVVDVSTSMLADDIRPSRLDLVKTDLAKLLDLMPGNKVGIIGFAGSATLLSPITNDPTALKMFIDSLSPLSVSSQGTDFQRAMSEAKDAFERGGVGGDPTTKVTRVILVASDGEDHEKGAIEQAQKLTEQGIRIFSIAYGTEKGAPIPERDSLGYLRGYKKDNKGQVILTQVHGEALKALASAGKGSFFFASPGGDYLKQIVEDINKLEKAEFQTEIATQYDEKFQYFLIFAFVFGLIEMILGERRGEFRIWKGRFEVPPA